MSPIGLIKVTIETTKIKTKKQTKLEKINYLIENPFGEFGYVITDMIIENNKDPYKKAIWELYWDETPDSGRSNKQIKKT
jgi:hypothetical protein